MDHEGYIYVSDFTNASILGTSDNMKGFDAELSSSAEKPGGMIAKYKLTDQNAIDIVEDDEDESEVHDGEGVGGGGGGCNMVSFLPLSGLILLPVFFLLRR
jgi:hypothetical protein